MQLDQDTGLRRGALRAWLGAVLSRASRRRPNGSRPDESRQWSAVRQEGSSSGGLVPLDLEDGRMLPCEAQDGRSGRPFVNPMGSAQAYFRVERPHRFANRPLDIVVEVLGDVGADIRIDYDSTDHEVCVVQQLPGAFKRTPVQALRPSGGWEELSFEIRDARFCGGVNSADLRVVSTLPHGPLRVRSLRVTPNDPLRDRVGTMATRLAFRRESAPEVSIIIPVWNQLDLTLDCLRAVRAGTEGSYEVIVVDNGSSPKAKTLLGTIPGLHLRRHRTNLGFARACNAGAAAARGRYVLFLNNDTVAQPGWFPPLLEAFAKDPRIAIAGSLLLYPNTCEVQHAGIAFTCAGIPYHRFRFCPVETAGVGTEGFVSAVTGACLLTRLDFFRRLGGFDEGFMNGHEDVDFCLRAREAGGRSFYCPKSVLLHHESSTAGRLDPRREAANLAHLLHRWRDRMGTLEDEFEDALALSADS